MLFLGDYESPGHTCLQPLRGLHLRYRPTDRANRRANKGAHTVKRIKAPGHNSDDFRAWVKLNKLDDWSMLVAQNETLTEWKGLFHKRHLGKIDVSTKTRRVTTTPAQPDWVFDTDFTVDHRSDYVTYWYCQAPPETQPFRVVRDEWCNDYTERHIYEIEVVEPVGSGSVGIEE